ncbi:hypothetical protein, partial [Halorhodospira neutriphila]
YAEGVAVALAAGEAAQPAEPAPREAVALPRIELPLAVELEALRIERLRIRSGEGAAQRIERIEVGLHAEGTRWRLRRLLVERPDARLALEGDLRTSTPSARLPPATRRARRGSACCASCAASCAPGVV